MNSLARTIVVACMLLTGCRSPWAGLPKMPGVNRIPGLSRDSRSTSSDEPMLAASAAAQSGQSMDALLKRADAEVQRGDLEVAKNTYREVLALKADHPLAHHRLAIIADRQSDFEAANFHYEFARRSKGADPDLLNDMGYSYFLQGDYKESERLLRRALEVRPTHRDALNNLGRLYSVQGKHSEASSMLRLANSEPHADAALAQHSPEGGPATNAPRIGSNLLAEPPGPLYAPELRPGDRPGLPAAANLADAIPSARVLQQEAVNAATLPRARFTDVVPIDETRQSPLTRAHMMQESEYADWNRISTSSTVDIDTDRAHHVSANADPPANARYRRAPDNVDPLDSMPVWPPTSSVAEVPAPVAPASRAW